MQAELNFADGGAGLFQLALVQCKPEIRRALVKVSVESLRFIVAEEVNSPRIRGRYVVMTEIAAENPRVAIVNLTIAPRLIRSSEPNSTAPDPKHGRILSLGDGLASNLTRARGFVLHGIHVFGRAARQPSRHGYSALARFAATNSQLTRFSRKAWR